MPLGDRERKLIALPGQQTGIAMPLLCKLATKSCHTSPRAMPLGNHYAPALQICLNLPKQHYVATPQKELG